MKKEFDYDPDSRLLFFTCEIDVFMDGIFHCQTQGMRKAINMSPVVFHINCLKIWFNNTIYNRLQYYLKIIKRFTYIYNIEGIIRHYGNDFINDSPIIDNGSKFFC